MIAAADQTDEGKAALKKQQDDCDALKAASMIGTATSEKAGFELIELEEAIKTEGGLWIKFIKAPSAAPAAAAGGKGAPAKGKPASNEDAKPIVAKAWLDLSDLAKPGCCKTSVRVFFETCAAASKESPESDRYVDAEEVI